VKTLRRIADFLFEAGMLKRTPRTGWQFLGSGEESVSDHTFRTALIAFVLASGKEDIDMEKVLKMALFHDLPEARTGDLNYMNQKYAKPDEEKAVADMTDGLPFGEEIAEILEEFTEQQSAEAKLVRDADNMEMLLSLKEHHDIGNKNAKDWIPFSEQRLKSDEAQKLAEAIKDRNSSAWWFDQDSDWWVKGGKV
jgi:putative hydrolase of HD superfamily